ncbi:MC family mitochondrial carrier protein [Lepidopterella palustris CBS 459.81]|uniref:MC family mitochondrial carrier protein n=1 Tax=Lepidopterella palustris CBS 459.81 TaxID=1314670 RepID=A0A8E2E0W0_9PEZI|nr:MC family mitochondrial carrier protein [Lepidopterella palustris CBS 459.81]
MSMKFNVEKQESVHKVKSGEQPIHYPLIFGGSAAAMAALITHPLDLVKVRLQTRTPSSPQSMLSTFIHIYRTQGISGLYTGLSASMLRQLTYSIVRFGVYEDLKIRFASTQTPSNPGTNLSFLSLIAMSSTAGFLGGIAGNPADVVNVRMQSDAAKPPFAQLKYKNALDGLVRMIREEGLPALFRGVGANCGRAVLMTSSQLASYDIFKATCLSTQYFSDNFFTQFISSVGAGFVATTICSPVDVVKTLIMSAGGKLPLLQTLHTIQRKEGIFWVLRGWVPSFIRLGPQTIITMLIFEQHKKLYRRWKMLKE